MRRGVAPGRRGRRPPGRRWSPGGRRTLAPGGHGRTRAARRPGQGWVANRKEGRGRSARRAQRSGAGPGATRETGAGGIGRKGEAATGDGADPRAPREAGGRRGAGRPSCPRGDGRPGGGGSTNPTRQAPARAPGGGERAELARPDSPGDGGGTRRRRRGRAGPTLPPFAPAGFARFETRSQPDPWASCPRRRPDEPLDGAGRRHRHDPRAAPTGSNKETGDGEDTGQGTGRGDSGWQARTGAKPVGSRRGRWSRTQPPAQPTGAGEDREGVARGSTAQAPLGGAERGAPWWAPRAPVRGTCRARAGQAARGEARRSRAGPTTLSVGTRRPAPRGRRPGSEPG